MAGMSIVVRFSFEGVHCWPDAEGWAQFLRDPHRHMFHVEAAKAVEHDDRQIEILAFRREMARYCNSTFCGPHTMSCEMMARRLMSEFRLSRCRVLEDNENGAEVVA